MEGNTRFKLLQTRNLILCLGVCAALMSNSCISKRNENLVATPKFSPISFNNISFVKNGKPFFLYSGEFHYFRVPKKDWKRRMELFKAAGGNCLSTYVPWLIHEPEEGKFLFGDTDTRDLEGFLKTAKEVGLYVIIRPGVYQYAELKNYGIPDWLISKYPQTRYQDIKGNFGPVLSYIHPKVLEKARIWLGVVCEILSKYTTDKNGPIAMVQLDNECGGVQLWGNGMDYNKESMGFGKPAGRYTMFLTSKFQNIKQLNKAYNTEYKTFEEVPPFDYRSAKDVYELRKAKDYTDFYFSTIADYFQFLEEVIRKNGINLPLVHNSFNTNANSYYQEAINKLGNNHFLLGVDHYYNLSQDWGSNNPDPQWAIRIFQSLETLRMFGYPPTVFEFPGGSLSDWPPITPTDIKAAYMMQMAFGLKGSNFYIFTGGPNPDKFGTTSDVYDYNAAISAEGTIRPLYETDKTIGQFISKNMWLCKATRVNDCRLAYNVQIGRSDLYWKNNCGFMVTDAELYKFSQTGMLNSLLCGSYSPNLCNLDLNDWMNDTITPLIVLTSEVMAEKYQKKIKDFLIKGGKIIMCPSIPQLNENFEPCTILKTFVGSPKIEINQNQNQRINFSHVKNVMVNEKTFISKSIPSNAIVLGKDENTNETIAWKMKTENGGTFVFLGMMWKHQMIEHIRMLDEILGEFKIKQIVKCNNHNLFTSLRTDGSNAMLFIMNLYSSPMQGNIEVFSKNGEKRVLNTSLNLNPMEVHTIKIKNYK